MAILLAKQVKAPQGLVCDGCMKMTGEIISALMSDSIEVSFFNWAYMKQSCVDYSRIFKKHFPTLCANS